MKPISTNSGDFGDFGFGSKNSQALLRAGSSGAPLAGGTALTNSHGLFLLRSSWLFLTKRGVVSEFAHFFGTSLTTMSPGVMGGGSDSGAILAAMDAGVTPGPASAGLPGIFSGSNGNGAHVQLHALAKIHDQKASPCRLCIQRRSGTIDRGDARRNALKVGDAELFRRVGVERTSRQRTRIAQLW